MSYEMQGLFLEACDCRVICPCWIDEDPDDASCTGLMAWYIENGRVGGVLVSGLTVVSVSHHEGNRRTGGQEVVLFIEDTATAVQAEALRATFTGNLGGPLGELKDLAGTDPIVRRAGIGYTHDGKATTLHIGDKGETVAVEMLPLVGALGRVTTLADSAPALLLGTPAELGRSSRLFININRAPLDLDLAQRGAARGRFDYRASDV
jgi:hypothetical protein